MTIENENCPCKRKKCERHGKCSECREHHKENPKKGLVYCERETNQGTRKERREAHKQERRQARNNK